MAADRVDTGVDVLSASEMGNDVDSGVSGRGVVVVVDAA